jgi:hypothetical protein
MGWTISYAHGGGPVGVGGEERLVGFFLKNNFALGSGIRSRWVCIGIFSPNNMCVCSVYVHICMYVCMGINAQSRIDHLVVFFFDHEWIRNESEGMRKWQGKTWREKEWESKHLQLKS